MKNFQLIAILGICVLGLSGCVNFSYTEQFDDKSAPIAPEAPVIEEPPQTVSVSYFVSPDKYTKYCNGEDMDSAGFKKVLTQKVTREVTGKFSSTQELVNKTLAMATTDAELVGQSMAISDKGLYTTYDGQPAVKISGSTAYIAPSGGWAGVSIWYCAWKPLVEKNLELFPEIKKVEWINDQQEFENFK